MRILWMMSVPRGISADHRLRKSVTALAIENVGKQPEDETAAHGGDGHGT
jgi:hypothetical protein